VLWLKDIRPGAGWGVLDHRSLPKETYHHLRRALAPVAVWSTDEGLGGVVAHVANDRAEPLQATLRVALYRDCEVLVGQATVPLDVAAHGTAEHNVEAVLGRFVDIGWTYRFGPPAQNLIVLSIERVTASIQSLVAQSFRFPVGRPIRREPAAALGLAASVSPAPDGKALLRLASKRLAYGVRIDAPGFTAADDAFSVEPGGLRDVLLSPVCNDNPPDNAQPEVSVTALNLSGRLRALVK
jgi:beta-mannosidase